MIVRDAPDATLLISQVDHARLAGDLAAAWGNDRVPGLPLADWLVPAVRDHDEGWRAWEAAPTVTADGRPRDFTEMPAAEAAAIWTRSIDCCAAGLPSSAEALRRLRADGGEIAPHDAAILDALLQHRGTVDIDRLTTEIVSQGDWSSATVFRTLVRFERKGLIRPLPGGVGGPAYAIDLPAVGESPLGGLWVSGHFRALAETAKEHRDDPGEVAVIDAFLADQDAKRAAWRAAVREFAGDELDRVIDTGTRYVRFFDRISLWLCMADRTEPWEATLSSSLSLSFTPRSPREMVVDPWPFGPTALELSAPENRISTEPFADAAALREALAAAERATLRWVLVRG